MLNGYIDVDVKQVALVLYSPLNLDLVVTQFLLFPFRFKVLIEANKAGFQTSDLGVPVAHTERCQMPTRVCIANLLQTNPTPPTGRLEMNSWKAYRGNNNNDELYESLVCYSSGTVPY